MLKTAHDAEEFMRTGARVSPSWPGGDLRGRIRCSRLISRRSRQNPLQTGRAIRFPIEGRPCSFIRRCKRVGLDISAPTLRPPTSPRWCRKSAENILHSHPQAACLQLASPLGHPRLAHTLVKTIESFEATPPRGVARTTRNG